VQVLSAEWLAEVKAGAEGLTGAEGDAELQFVVSAAPSGKVQFVVSILDGRVADVRGGKAASADCTLSYAYADFVAELRGELDPDVAYMQGRVKVEGDYPRYLQGLRPLLHGPAFRRVLAQVTPVS
jgi:hypothetical protein